MKIGVIVGRFQVPRLHDGHLHLINTALSEFDKVIIFIGVTKDKKLTSHDPLPFEARKLMILESNPDLIVYPIQDVGNWEKWVEKLDELIDCVCKVEYFDNPEIFILGSRDSMVSGYKKSKGKYKTKYITAVGSYSGTQSRNKILESYTPTWNYDSRALVTWYSGNI